MPDYAYELTAILSHLHAARASRLRRMFAIVAAAVALPLAAVAPDTGVAVFGSFLNGTLAEREHQRLAQLLATELRVAPVAGGDAVRHRIVSSPMSAAEARALVRAAKARGVDAWYLAAASPQPAVAESAPAPPAPQASATPAVPVPDVTAEDVAAALAQPAGPAPTAEAPPSDNTTPPALTPARPDAPPPNGSAVVALRIDEPDIVIDGRVDEAVWQQAPAYDNMRVMEPETLAAPTFGTASRFIYSHKGLYVSAVMEQPPETLVARLSSRDQFINRDGYGITLDTSGEGLYGYWFSVSLGGSLADGKVAAERTFTNQWDGPWHGASAQTASGWSVEMFLPWAMMSMPASGPERRLGFWVNRKVAHMDERYSWPVLPYSSPRFMSALEPLALRDVRPTKQWAVFPYASLSSDSIYKENAVYGGVDVVWRPSSNLQLTAALNPDFGAVESDDVVVNLTAFETYFPEKRLFFLEGQEVFETSPRANPRSSSSGPQGQGARRSPQTFFREPTTLLNTRRIGGQARHVEVPDEFDIPDVERSRPTDLLGAVKAVGQSGGMRYGFLGAFEDEVALRGTRDGENALFTADGRNFGATRVLYESTTAEGRRGIGYLGTVVDKGQDQAIVHGIDTHILGADGRVEWDTQFIASDVDAERGYGVFTDIAYAPKIGTFGRCSFDYLDEHLDVGDFGYVRRTDSLNATCGVFKTVTHGLPDRLRNVRSSFFASYEENTDGLATRSGMFAGTGFTFSNNAQLRLMVNYFPSRWDDLNSRGNGAFRVRDRTFAQAQFGTDSAKPLSVSVAFGVDGEELGGTTVLFDTGFTFTPTHRFSIDFDLRYKARDGWLVHRGDREFTTYRAFDMQPRLAIDLFLTAKQQFRLTTQWAGIKARKRLFLEVPEGGGELVPRATPLEEEDFSISRLVAQARYRWEIGPLSDLFVVYTRGGNLPDRVTGEFTDLFLDAVNEPVVDVFIVKLRYRFGS